MRPERRTSNEIAVSGVEENASSEQGERRERE